MFNLARTKVSLKTLSLPDVLTVRDGLERVLRLPSVASKRYLINKVKIPRGKIARINCVGWLIWVLAQMVYRGGIC